MEDQHDHLPLSRAIGRLEGEVTGLRTQMHRVEKKMDNLTARNATVAGTVAGIISLVGVFAGVLVVLL